MHVDHRQLQLKRCISLLFLKILCHLYPLECTFASSGLINGVNLQKNVHVEISQYSRWPLINGVAALRGSSYTLLVFLFITTFFL